MLFNNEQVAAIRTDGWKYVVRSYYRTLDFPVGQTYEPLLFDVRDDPAEAYNLRSLHSEVANDLADRLQRARAKFEPMGTRYKRA